LTRKEPSTLVPVLKQRPFEGLGHLAGLFGNRYLSDEEREFLRQVEDFCTDNRLEYEIIDLGTLSVLAKMKLRLKGVKTTPHKLRRKNVMRHSQPERHEGNIEKLNLKKRESYYVACAKSSLR
jgi:hypothetical protein